MAEANGARRAPTDHVNELKSLVVGYAKQETVDPLKSLGRYLGYGIAGAVLVGFGCIFLLLGLLRLLQSVGPFEYNTGAWSLVPYAITFVVALIIVGAAGFRITKVDKKGQPS